MSNLVLAIIFTSWLLVSFRVFDFFNVDNLQAIIFNYIVCAFTGFFFSGNYSLLCQLKTIDTWIVMACITGACFLPTFYLMSYTVKKVSVTISTVASKTSLVIPVMVSIFYLNNEMKFSILNYTGIVLGFGAILLCSLKQKINTDTTNSARRFDFFLPGLVFLGGGLVDVLINIANYRYIPIEKSSLFPFFAFSVAAIAGFILLTGRVLFLKENLNYRNLIAGIVLGIPNYLSIYFLLKALHDFDNNGAILFPALNISVILINSFVSFLFFKERLTNYNYVGLFLAVIALMLITSS
jgi:uncharacterized membrane protein